MATRTSRRAFIRAEYLRDETMRPYGAVAAEIFRKTCDGCGDCARACGQGIIRKDHDGLAALDPRAGECTFCGDCIEACPTGALRPESRQDWDWIAAVGMAACLSLSGVLCRTCEDSCDRRAIGFRLERGGRARPLVDPIACTGCGACAASCPAGAIGFARRNLGALEATG